MPKKYLKKASLILVISLVFSPFFAVPAKAQWVVWDPGNFVPNSISAAANVDTAINTTVAGPVKEFGLDSIAWMIANIIMQRIAASTINWINSGFHGSPAFVTDPGGYFQNLGDKIAGQYIFSNPNLNFLCGPISAKIRLLLVQNYIREPVWQCTLTQVGKNLDNFMGDFANGGWDNFFQVSQVQQNNPMGAYMQAQNELNLQIATRQGIEQTKLNWGRGFMSWESCNGTEDPDGFCNGSLEINTPGSVIQDQLDKVLGSGGDKLAVSDEINEIVSALLNQMINQVVGGIGKGLRGMSGSGSSDQTSLTGQLSNSNVGGTKDYFGNTQDTSILDAPLPTKEGYQAAGNSTSGQPTNPVYPTGTNGPFAP